MNTLTPHQKAAIEYHKHISLVANAGSGKTFVLSNRFVEIFLNEEIELSSIVAITFTEKAAGELYKKIASHVIERLKVETDISRKRRLIKLQQELVQANISTIHSFCKSLLEEFSPEAEIDSSFVQIDNVISDELKELSVDEIIQAKLKNPDDENSIKYLIRFFGSKNLLAKALIKTFDKRKIIQQLQESLYSKNEEEVFTILNSLFNEKFDKYFVLMINELIEKIKVVNLEALKSTKAKTIAVELQPLINNYKKDLSQQEKIILLQKIKQTLFTKANGIQKKYRNEIEDFEEEFEFIETAFNEFKSIINVGINIDANKELVIFSKNFISLFESANELYTEKKKQKSYLDFEDLLLLARKILQKENVQQSLSEKFKYIMIDEYQDTNEIQYEIVMPLLDDLRKGNLFVVGDEKQSIYSFREAELELFERTRDKIKENGKDGLILSLPHSFRMYPGLVLFVNKLFQRLFQNANKDFNEVAYSYLVCTKNDSELGKVGLLIAEKESEISEASLVIKKIIELNQREKYKFSEFAILCRKRDAFVELENELVKNKIPYTIVGGKGFYQQQTIYDIYNYLSFITNQKDDAALIGILRAPFFNLSDLELYEISKEDGETYFDKLANLSKKKNKFESIVEALQKNISIAKSSSLPNLIRKILVESGYWALIAHKNNSEQELANVEKLLGIAREFSSKPFSNLYDFVMHLKVMINEDDQEGQALIAKDHNSVKLMTIHQAKGLEFQILFVYDTNSKAQQNTSKARDIFIDKEFGIITKITADNYFDSAETPPIGLIYDYVIQRKSQAELKRLLYVASTRAIEQLYFSATISKNKNGEVNISKGSFFQLLIEGLGDFTEKEKIFISDQVDFLTVVDEEYKNFKKNISIYVPIEKQIETSELKIENEQSKVYKKYIQQITDQPVDEIISATKISIYQQCPVKYQLTYEYGYQPILELLKSEENDFEFQPNEEDEKLFGKIRGKIIHKLLSKNKNEDLSQIIMKELERNNLHDNSSSMLQSIKNELEKFFSSSTYKMLSSFENYKNEFEIYTRKEGYILYGIIDKLIIKDDELLIVDYKTDNIKEVEINKRAENYFNQLMFYALVLSSLYPAYKKFSLQLIFLKHPEIKVIRHVSYKELSEHEFVIKDAVEKIYKQNYQPNYGHCSQCHFYWEEKKCIKEIQ